MKKLILVFSFFVSALVFAQTKVQFNTTMGELVLELNESEAPITTANFLAYVRSGHYNGLIFHRVISDFVVQGGGHLPDMTEVPTRDPIRNEANNGLSNLRGTIGMARETAPHTATAQFYFNVKDNAFLDYQSEERWGYCVFGRIVSGLKVLDQIRQVETKSVGDFEDVPVEPIVINSVVVLQH